MSCERGRKVQGFLLNISVLAYKWDNLMLHLVWGEPVTFSLSANQFPINSHSSLVSGIDTQKLDGCTPKITLFSVTITIFSACRMLKVGISAALYSNSNICVATFRKRPCTIRLTLFRSDQPCGKTRCFNTDWFQHLAVTLLFHISFFSISDNPWNLLETTSPVNVQQTITLF